jgi:hypothetical protein
MAIPVGNKSQKKLCQSFEDWWEGPASIRAACNSSRLPVIKQLAKELDIRIGKKNKAQLCNDIHRLLQ